MLPPVFIVIVTHDSAPELQICLANLTMQAHAPEQVVIVDSGSEATQYLDNLDYYGELAIYKKENIGFSRANNFGFSQVPVSDESIVVFMNPDTFLAPEFLARMCQLFAQQKDVSLFTGKLLGYDLARGVATGKIDSTGIFRRWYGRWYDRGQGEEDRGQYDGRERLLAACGALLCCRGQMLRQLAPEIFHEDFFMYKEDIELGMRLRKLGFSIMYDSSLVAYHCRGWQATRKKMAPALRLHAARNEVLLYRKHPSPYMLWALGKYLLVRFLGA